MSLATPASARALFGDTLSPQQKIAANLPATAAAANFAEILAGKQGFAAAAASLDKPAPTPEQLARSLFGEAYDPATKSVRVDKLASSAQKRTAEFAEQLRRMLAAEGINADIPFELNLGADGRIIVDGGHPDAARIASLFEDNAALAQAYRDIAARNDHIAMLQAGAAYVEEWNAATTEPERQAIWGRYGTLMDRLTGLFSGRTTFGPGTVISESQQIVRRMGMA